MDQLLHAVLSAEKDDFANLLRIAKLDPATDLRGCDFRGVDFGDLTANIIDLSRCDLTGANLSKVRGNLNLQGAIIYGAKLPKESSYNKSVLQTAVKVKFSLLRQILISAHRFYLPPKVEGRVIGLIEHKIPVMTCYRSHTEHQLIEESIRSAIIGSMDEKVSHLFDRRTNHASIKVTEFSSKSSLSRLNVGDIPSLDGEFFHSLRDCQISTLFNKQVEIGFLARIIDNFRLNGLHSASDLRELTVFASNLDGIGIGRSRFVVRLQEHSTKGLNIFLMNGLSPFSLKMYNSVEKLVPNSRSIWILPSNVLYNDVPVLIKNGIIPKCSIVYPNETLSFEDIQKFIKRFEAYRKYGLILTDETKLEILKQVNKPVGILKNMFIAKVFEAAQSRSDENGSIIL